jgi:transposase
MGWRPGQRYSQDLRDRVLSAVDGGMSVIAAAATFQVSRAYIYKALMRRRVTGDSGANPNRGHAPRKLTPAREMALAAHIKAHPGITLARVKDWLEAEHGVSLSTGGTWNAVHRLGLSHKKSR